MMKRIAYLLSGKISFIAVFLCLIINVKGQEITIDPVDSTENVSVSTEIIITLTDSAYNTNSTELTSTNIDALIILREGGKEGIAVQFDATINNTKNTITVIPNNSLEEKATYYVSVGNGITVTGEHFLYSIDDKPYSTNNDTQMTGLMAMYPISLLDNISGMVFYSWDAELAYFFISWQRTYDDWTINLNTFFSSESDSSFSFGQSFSNFNSRGIQLMLIFNH